MHVAMPADSQLRKAVTSCDNLNGWLRLTTREGLCKGARQPTIEATCRRCRPAGEHARPRRCMHAAAILQRTRTA